jgi:ParB family chromosome partitioning protein
VSAKEDGVTTKSSALGKGLGALLSSAVPVQPVPVSSAAPATGATAFDHGTQSASANPAPSSSSSETANKDRHPGISLAHVDDIVENQFQPRRQFDEKALQELSDSIKTNGIIQPLVVRKVASGYELIAGERRLRAAKKAGLNYVPVVIRKSTDKEALELALVENIQRQDLNCVDEALAYSQLMEDFSLTQEEAAKRVGKERATVANSIRLLKLPDAVLEDLRSGALTSGHGKALLALEGNENRLKVRLEIHDRKLSVRETEQLVQQINAQKTKNASADALDAPNDLSAEMNRIESISKDLTQQWFAKVRIAGNATRGKFVIQYGTRQEFERILASLQKGAKT